MHLKLTLVALFAVCLSMQTLLAQNDSKPAKQANTISVRYKGGSLAGFLDLVREQYPKVNIVASPAASDVEVPELKISNAPVYSALVAVSAIAPSDYSVRVEAQPGQGADSEPVYAVRVQRTGPQNVSFGGTAKPETALVRVFSIRNMTQVLPGMADDKSLVISADTILLALDTGLGITESKQKATIRYHEDSGLIFVRATPQQMDVVEQTLRSIDNDLSTRRRAAQSRPRPRPAPNQKKDK